MGRKMIENGSIDGDGQRAPGSLADDDLRGSIAQFQEELAKELESIGAARAARALAATAIAELARRYAPRTPGGRTGRMRGGHANDAPTIEELCAALIQDDPTQRHNVLSRFRAFGMTGEQVFETLIPAAARRLGELWVEDEVCFTDVAIGVSRLEETARSNEPSSSVASSESERPPAVLLWVPRNEEHTLGAFIAADRFRKEGYAVELSLGASEDALLKGAESWPHALIGISCGSRRLLEPLTSAVSRLRGVVDASVPIIIGGPIVEIEPQAAAIIGADGLASDVRLALSRLEKARAAMPYR